MATCKFCQSEIVWMKQNGKNVPTNMDGSPHRCRSTETQQAMQKAGFKDDSRPVSEVTKEQQEYNERAAAANPNPSNSTGLKTVEGQIVFIDPGAHKITVKDRNGEQHTFIWQPPLHEVMSQLKQWWFVKLTGEQEKDFPDIWKLTAKDFFKRPDDWPFAKGGSGGGKYQPRNEGLIVYQTCYKEACETVRALVLCSDQVLDEEEYNRLMDIALNRAIKDGKALLDAGSGS